MSTPQEQFLSVEQFVISCGTVTLDPQRSKVLLIQYRKTGQYLLPKGRKDIGERLEEAAVRETFEETGFRVELLPVSIPTLATLPSSSKPTEDGLNPVTEPIAMTQRTTRAGVFKVIFWFVAAGDSTAYRVEGTQQEDEDFDPVWVDFKDASSMLSFDDAKSAAALAIAAASLVV